MNCQGCWQRFRVMLDILSQYMHYYLVLLCEVQKCHCVKARDHCCVFCYVTRDLLFTWYIVHQPRFLPPPDVSWKIERDCVRRVAIDQLSSVRFKKHT